MNKLLAFTAIVASLFSSDGMGAATSLMLQDSPCVTLLAGPGLNVRDHYRNVKIHITEAGEFAIPHGSKAFIYWRGKTPGHIPPSAFAFQYLTVPQIRTAIALQSAEGYALSPFEPPPSLTASGLFGFSNFFELRTNEGARQEFDREHPNSVRLGYLCFRVPGFRRPRLLLFKTGYAQHQRNWYLIEMQIPGSQLLFGGTISMVWNSFFEGPPTLDFVAIDDTAFIRGVQLEGRESLRTLLPLMQSQLGFSDEPIALRNRSWRELDEVRGSIRSLEQIPLRNLMHTLESGQTGGP